MKLNKTILLTLVACLVVTISGYAAYNALKDTPSKTVKKYWQLASDGKLDQARELKADMSSTSPMGEDGTAVAGNIKNSDGTIQDCCMVKQIGEQQLKITKIIETIEENQNALVTVEAENKDQKSEIFVNCLSRRRGRWIVTGISPDIYEDRNALCFSTGKPLRPKRFNQ